METDVAAFEQALLVMDRRQAGDIVGEGVREMAQCTDEIRHSLYEIEWEYGEVISSIVRNRKDWESEFFQAIPFHQKVTEEGIRL